MTDREQIKNRLVELFGEEVVEGVELDFYFSPKRVRKKNILLSSGEIAEHIYIIVKGCIRQFFCQENGTEITTQFFMENQIVASIDSFITGKASKLYLESLEECDLLVITKDKFEKISHHPLMQAWVNDYLKNRLYYYMEHSYSFILKTPEERYYNLVKEHQEIFMRIPSMYIASYLGITPVSLSRIRNRNAKTAVAT